MSNYRMQMPAQYTSIGDDERVLLCGGETTAWQTFQDIGRVLNYVARIFSAGSSIVNNVVTIVNYFNKLEDLLPVIGDDERVLLCGGETTAWQTFQDIGRVLNYVARIFSAGSSIVNNVVTIVNYFNKLEDLLPVIGEV